MINNACMIQHTYSNNNVFGNAFSFVDMQRLTYPRHSAYCSAHNIDYWSFQGGKYPEMPGEAGAWSKVGLMKEALLDYEYVFWVDVDTAIMDFETDLREAVEGDINIGGVYHDPAKSEYLKVHGVEKHINIGVLYIKNTEISRLFINKWFDSFPGPPRWADQGAFNALIDEIPHSVTGIEDKWNATINVNEVEKPVIFGWHGVNRPERFLVMKRKLATDHLIYTV
jgi:hypothetical protein